MLQSTQSHIITNTVDPAHGSLQPRPRHLRQPGQDGYRTPTVEDPEHRAHHGGATCVASASQLSRGLEQALQHQPPASNSGGCYECQRLGHDPHYCHVKDHPNLLIEWPSVLTLKQRVKHVTWAYFTVTMATGGIANVLSMVPFRFRGLETIGVIFFLFNIVLYVCIWTLILLRFYWYPYTFKASFTHPTESLFIPAVAVSFGTILINIVEYGFGKVGDWLNTAVVVLFWLDAALAVVLSVGIYLILWSTQYFSVATMTPIWTFPAYPLLIIGPHAGNLSRRIASPSIALDVIIGGFTIQGVGFLVSLTIYAAFVYRLMTQKLPRESIRPGMFVSVGPSAFTVSGTINMAASAQKAIPAAFMGDGKLTAQILVVVGNWMSLWLWGLALWFFFVSVGAHWSCVRTHSLPFAMTWWSFVFPNTALTTATFAIGTAFASHAILVVGCAMTGLLVAMWAFVFAMMVRAIATREIMWPQKGGDRDEGGFKHEPVKKKVEGDGDGERKAPMV